MLYLLLMLQVVLSAKAEVDKKRWDKNDDISLGYPCETTVDSKRTRLRPKVSLPHKTGLDPPLSSSSLECAMTQPRREDEHRTGHGWFYSPVDSGLKCTYR
jgi:hypothetical protein